MFDHVILDVFIGLFFIFTLFSLLATIFQELLAHHFSLRARMLQKALRKMLEDMPARPNGWFRRSTFYNYIAEIFENLHRFFVPRRPHEHFIRKFYEQPSIKYLGEDRQNSKPAYLQPHNFSHTMVQLLRGPAYDGSVPEAALIKNALDHNTLDINPETLTHLRNLFADARQDVIVFRHRLEQWFDETMQRTNGWYKRQSQVMLIFLGFGIAWFFNIDTIAIAKILSKDKKAREQLVTLAVNRQAAYKDIIDSVMVRSQYDSVVYRRDTTASGKDTTVPVRIPVSDTTRTVYRLGDKYFDSAYKTLMADASLARTILGLNREVPDSIANAHKHTIDSLNKRIRAATSRRELNRLEAARNAIRDEYKAKYLVHPYQKSTALKLLGWLLTAYAISLGAPFWFDILNKVIQLRASGPRVPTGSAGNVAKGSTDAVLQGVTPDGKPIRG